MVSKWILVQAGVSGGWLGAFLCKPLNLGLSQHRELGPPQLGGGHVLAPFKKAQKR